MVEEDDSVVCDGGEVEDVHFILECEEFEWDRWELLDRVRRIVGSELWGKEYEEGDDDTYWVYWCE